VRRAAVALLAVALVVPTTAEAKRVFFGSNLKANVNHAIARATDTVFWAKRLPNKRRVRSPVKGRVDVVIVKGTAIKQNNTKPNTLFHLQTLRPAGDGKVFVKFTSGDFHMPVGGNPNRLSSFRPENLCVKKGDWVSFADVGGYQSGSYPHGTPFKIFSNVDGATTNIFHNNNGLSNGQVIKGKPKQGLELMMRMAVVTGDEAGVCH
jgi:hypothetical protein